MKGYLWIVALLVVSGLFSGCVTTDSKPQTQTEIKTFETRTVDAPFEQVYSAATEGLFDLGYTISHSDKSTGVLVGQKRVLRDFAKEFSWAKVMIDVLDDDKVSSSSEKDKYEMLELTLFIQSLDQKTTKVRIKTAVDKQAKFDKDAVDQAWVYIQRQVLMESVPTTDIKQDKGEKN